MNRPLACLLLCAALLLLPRPLAAADLHPFDLPPGFAQEVLARDLGPATAFALRPDGSILIARKHGSVKVWRDGQVLEAPFLDLSGEVNRYGDRGLMGIAVHPNFPQPAYVYLAYAYEPAEAAGHAESGARTARVVRVEANPANLDQARPGSLVVLLGKNGGAEYAGDLDRGDRPPYSCMAGDGEQGGGADAKPVQDCLPVDGPSHTVDGLVFGPDGALYVSAGDGTLQPDLNVRAQNLDSLAGKILRIDPITGVGLPDNPFYNGDGASNRAKVYALGLRNPYRFTFAPDGALVVGDVGGERWEEINRGAAGANFGWPCREGPLPNSGAAACAGVLSGSVATVSAWHGYAHEGGYSAAIGGDFYTGDQFPASYQGAYFFADHNRAALLYLPAGAGPDAEARLFASNVIAPVQITMGPDGSLYVLSFVDGALSRIRYTGAAHVEPAAPEIESGAAGETVDAETVDAETVDAETVDAETVDAETVDAETVDAETVDAETVDGAPVVTITAPADGSVWPEGAAVELAGTAAAAGGKPLSGAALQWTATLHHNAHVHPDFFHGSGAEAQLLFEPHGPNAQLEVCLSATDSAGQTGSACITLRQCGEIAQTPCVALPTTTPPAADSVGSASHGVTAEGGSAAHAGVQRTVWLHVGGADVADLVAAENYPDQPDAVEALSGLETSGLGKDYGERLSGFLLPPETGEYRFWIAADDSGELWLSTDADPANARLIAFTTTWTRQYEWDKHPSQASAPIRLQAGERYYIEVRHKQADQKDNLAVAWQPPGGERKVIAAPYLAAE